DRNRTRHVHRTGCHRIGDCHGVRYATTRVPVRRGTRATRAHHEQYTGDEVPGASHWIRTTHRAGRSDASTARPVTGLNTRNDIAGCDACASSRVYAVLPPRTPRLGPLVVENVMLGGD